MQLQSVGGWLEDSGFSYIGLYDCITAIYLHILPRILNVENNVYLSISTSGVRNVRRCAYFELCAAQKTSGI